MNEQKLRMETLLKALEIPYKSMNILGAVNCNIHIECIGQDTAEKWNSVLHKFCSRVKVVERFVHNKENKGTVLLPTVHKVFLIGAVV